MYRWAIIIGLLGRGSLERLDTCQWEKLLASLMACNSKELLSQVLIWEGSCPGRKMYQCQTLLASVTLIPHSPEM